MDVHLRPPETSDAEVHYRYPPQASIARMYGAGAGALPKPTMERSYEWLAWIMGQSYGAMMDVDGEPVGHVRLHSLSEADRKARLAIGLFSEAMLGRGVGRRAITLCLDHAFGPMGLHRVDLRVLAFNTRAIRCYLACGFHHEGTEREAALIDGVWHDDWIMGILAHEHQRRAATGIVNI